MPQSLQIYIHSVKKEYFGNFVGIEQKILTNRNIEKN